MASRRARAIRRVLAKVVGEENLSVTEDQGTIFAHVGDAGEISIYATKVPVARAAFALQCLRGDFDSWFLEREKDAASGQKPGPPPAR